ncbi:MAG: hypothetical protein RJA34_3069 [Pseudomonadota bacterium]
MPGSTQGVIGDAAGGGAGVSGANASAAMAKATSMMDVAKALEAAKPAADAAPSARPLPARSATANQFQRFVQESTGRALPIYGSNLFDTAQAYAPDTALPVPAQYLLGPGDEVRVQVWGATDYAGSHTLDRNGQITLPKVGVFSLAGVPVRDLESVLRGQIAKVFTNFNVSASLGRLRSIQIYVVGQAQQPGTFQLSSLSTLVNALFASGGPSANGSMRNIQLTRGGKTITTIDLYDFISKGDKGKDMPLQPGDVIVIPPVGPRVAVTGALDQAAIYELKPAAVSTTVGDILALSGGVPALASAQKALIERITPGSNPPRQVQDLSLDTAGLQQPLRDGDVLTLLGISPAFANAVTLQGTVAAPLRYRWFEGMKILDLIPERDALITADYYKRKNLLVQSTESGLKAGQGVDARMRAMVDEINWDYAVIERLDRNKLSTQLLPFNLGKAVLQRDPANNLALLPGDVVTVMSQNDLRMSQDRQTRLVRLEGEVAAPGVYQALPGETLPQLIRRLGGLTPQAYVFGTELSRESVRKRQQENLDTLIRRLEVQSQSQASSLTANMGADRVAQAQALQQQQQAQLKSQVERLKALKSNGRVALELDPTAANLAALPALPLEDGDRILVPATPGFVSAFGSVNNENVFIHKPGKTVADIIKSAGLTEDAEPDQAFVLRADGSIVARRDRSGLFGGNFESLQVMPGDTVVVPAQLDRETRYNFVTRVVKDWTQILSNFGLGAAAIKTLRN